MLEKIERLGRDPTTGESMMLASRKVVLLGARVNYGRRSTGHNVYTIDMLIVRLRQAQFRRKTCI